jgi:hypothetical protein
MKTLLLGLLFMSATSFSQSTKPDLEAIKIPLELYIKAHETGKGEFIVSAFSAEAKIVGHIAEKPILWGVAEYAARFSGKPADDEQQRQRSVEVLSYAGSAAIAKVVLDYPVAKFTDYMSVLKIAGEWKIVSKVFYMEVKPPAK